MCKKLTAIVLLLFALPHCLFCQSASEVSSSVKRIAEIVQELKEISIERENYLQELENTNNERKLELQERLNELQEREKELNELKYSLELFGNLIDDQAAYYRSLNRKLIFWQGTSGILLTALITALILTGINN